MAIHAHIPHLRWATLEREAFGLIYGAIIVLSLLMALSPQPVAPFKPAAVLFGSVLAMTLARALAALIAHSIETGERMLRVSALREAWRGSHPILFVAHLPTALFIASGLGWLPLQTAMLVSQLFCILILVIFGARVGWVISHGPWLPVLGALFAGGLGSALALLKYAMQ
ncbi:MAG: hypothetical protein AAFQ85_10340 [Pseudomonadota bacterium]